MYAKLEDVVLPMAGRGTGRPKLDLQSQGKKYNLELTSLVNEPQTSTLTVTVISSECKEAVEGRIIKVIDETTGRTLLKGKVIDGRVTRKVKNLGKLEKLKIDVIGVEEDE